MSSREKAGEVGPIAGKIMFNALLPLLCRKSNLLSNHASLSLLLHYCLLSLRLAMTVNAAHSMSIATAWAANMILPVTNDLAKPAPKRLRSHSGSKV
jgi:hypothetical protein